MTAQGPDDPTSSPGEGHTSRFEYLPEDETAPPVQRRGRRRAVAGVGALALVVLAGAGAYGLMQFMSSGDSAATAVPDTALGYLSLDLDPSGGQKLAAYETMRKFPALKEQLGLRSDDDPRRWIVDAINNSSGCALDFDEDIAPWLGHEVAFSAVDGEEEPEPFFVLEVTDADAAEAGIATLFGCGGEQEEHGTAMVGDFMVVAPEAGIAEDIAADAEESPLSDDDTFAARTDDAGDPGIMTGYLAPEAVELMLGQAEALSDAPEPDGASDELGVDPLAPAGAAAALGPEVDMLRDYLAGFEGAAMQLRFADEGVEMELVAAGIDQLEDLEPGTAGMADLPGTTALAYGLGMGGGTVDMIEETVKGQMSDAEYESEVQRFEQETGLTFPDDVRTLLGDGLSLAVDGSIDIGELGRTFMGGGDPARVELPAGLRIVTDDTEGVLEVTDKLQALIPPGMPLTMEVAEGDGAVAVGVDPDYVAQLAGAGDLGDSAEFEDAVPDADDSLGGIYVDFDAQGWLADMLGQEDPEALANLEPLSSMGMSTSADGDTGRMLLRLTTD